MPLGWFKSRRRRKLLAAPFPAEWRETLRRRVRQYQYLPAAQQERIRAIVPVMVAEKEWAGAAGFEVTDEMRVTIAGYAGLLAAGFDPPYFYDRLETFVLHPKSVRFTPEQSAAYPMLPSPVGLDGVAWQRGPVLLSWSAVRDERRGPSHGRNVVLHELAHHVDGLNGDMDGLPPLGATASRAWRELMEAELDRLEFELRRGDDTLLDEGAAESPAEFFAVATERFFELPHEMRREHAELYESLSSFYQQDPTEWLPRND